MCRRPDAAPEFNREGLANLTCAIGLTYVFNRLGLSLGTSQGSWSSRSLAGCSGKGETRVHVLSAALELSFPNG